MLSLPGLNVAWDDVTEGPGEVWTAWHVFRRRSAYTDAFGVAVAAGSWTRIAVITDRATLDLDDYTTEDEIEYDYAVTWVANVAGTLLESDKQASPPTLDAAYAYAWLHRVDNPAYYTLLRGHPPASFKPVQSIKFAQVKGRAEPTPFVDEAEASQIAWSLVPADMADPNVWERLRLMISMQKDEAVRFCFRPAHSRERFFVSIVSPTRNDGVVTREVTLQMQQVYHEEAV